MSVIEKLIELEGEDYKNYKREVKYLDHEFGSDTDAYVEAYSKIIEKLFGETIDNNTRYVVRYTEEITTEDFRKHLGL